MPQKKDASTALIKRMADRVAANRKSGNGFGASARIQLASHSLAVAGTCFGPNCDRVLPSEKTMDSLILEGESQTIWTPESENVQLEKATSKASFKVVAGDLDVPANSLIVMRHVLTSARKDRDGDILHPDGATVDSGAPLLWQHIWTMPVGKVVGIVEQTPEVLKVVSAVVDLKNQLTADIAELVDANVLRFSHGFQAKRFTQMKNGGGLDITEYEIMEASLVSVPSNVDAVVEMYAKGTVKSAEVGLFAKGLSNLLRRNLGVGMEFSEKTTSVDPGQGEDPEEPETQEESTPGEETPEGGKSEGESKESGTGCGCGGKKSGEPGTKDLQTLELKRITDSSTKSIGYGMFEGSYEWILRCLQNTAKSWLTGGGVNCTDRFVWNVATFPDCAIFCAEHYSSGSPNEHLFFKGKYEISDGVMRFTEAPEAVRLEINVVSMSQRIDAMEIEGAGMQTEVSGETQAEPSESAQKLASKLAAKLAEAREYFGTKNWQTHEFGTKGGSPGETTTETQQAGPQAFDIANVEESLLTIDTDNLKRLKRVVDAVNMLRSRESLRKDAKAVLAASRK